MEVCSLLSIFRYIFTQQGKSIQAPIKHPRFACVESSESGRQLPQAVAQELDMLLTGQARYTAIIALGELRKTLFPGLVLKVG